MGYRVTRVTAHYKGCIFLKSEYSQYIDKFLSTSLLGYRVTRVKAHYKDCIFLKLELSKYINEFLSTSLWVTGLQGLQHITRVAHF